MQRQWLDLIKRPLQLVLQAQRPTVLLIGLTSRILRTRACTRIIRILGRHGALLDTLAQFDPSLNVRAFVQLVVHLVAARVALVALLLLRLGRRIEIYIFLRVRCGTSAVGGSGGRLVVPCVGVSLLQLLWRQGKSICSKLDDIGFLNYLLHSPSILDNAILHHGLLLLVRQRVGGA